MVEYDESVNGERRIYCTYDDTEIATLYTNVQCPYCNHKQQEMDMNNCGTTYTIQCDNRACKKKYNMYFDAS